MRYLIIRIPLEETDEQRAEVRALARAFLDGPIPDQMRNPNLVSVEEMIGEGLIASGLQITDDDFKVAIGSRVTVDP